MKKLLMALFVACLSVLILSGTAAAVDTAQQQMDAIDLKNAERALPRSAKNLLGSQKADLTADFGQSLGAMLSRAWKDNPGIWRTGIESAMRVFAIAALCGLAAGVLDSADNRTNVVAIAGALALLGTAVVDLNTLMGLGRQALQEMNVFSKALLPVLTTAAVAAGTPAGATARHAAMIFACDVVITTISTLMLPLCFAHAALVTANAVTGNDSLAKIAGLVKWAVTTSLKFILSIFMAYMGLAGVISGAADAVAVKTVKFAVSGAIPVVGGIMADASEAVLAGAAMVKNAVGVFGLLGILAIILVPVARIGVQYVCYRAAAAFSGIACRPELSKLIDGLGDSFGLVTGMTGASAILMLVSVFSAVAAAGPL